MRVDLYPEFLGVLNDAARLLKHKDFFLWRRGDEASPESIPLSFRPVLSEKIVKNSVDKTACTLCANRISYKKNQFSDPTVSQPYLFLIHNDFLGPRAGYFNSAGEDALFSKMLDGVLGFGPASALTREILRCHFSPDDTGLEQQVKNCETHIRRDIEKYRIKGVMLFGKAATCVFRDKAALAERQNKVFDWLGLPAMVCAGPNRLQYMRDREYPKSQIDAERQKIFETLRIFKVEVIGTH